MLDNTSEIRTLVKSPVLLDWQAKEKGVNSSSFGQDGPYY